MKKIAVILILWIVVLSACSVKRIPDNRDSNLQGNIAPTAVTTALNEKVLKELPFSDQQDFIECRKGLIASDPDLRVKDREGNLIWNQPAYKFIKGKAPSS